MNRAVILSLILLSGAVATPCAAQSTIGPPSLRPNARPTTSPYLFLSGSGRSSAALNYYRQVRPQRDFLSTSQQQARSLNALGQDVSRLQQQSVVNERALIGPTGHSTTFFNFGSYFTGSPASGGFRSGRR